MSAIFPTADQVATAIVTACRVTGDGTPILVATGGGGTRARIVAFEGLRSAFPYARRPGLMRSVGFSGLLELNGVTARVSLAKKRSWWRDEYVDEVVGALIGEGAADE